MKKPQTKGGNTGVLSEMGEQRMPNDVPRCRRTTGASVARSDAAERGKQARMPKWDSGAPDSQPINQKKRCNV